MNSGNRQSFNKNCCWHAHVPLLTARATCFIAVLSLLFGPLGSSLMGQEKSQTLPTDPPKVEATEAKAETEAPRENSRVEKLMQRTEEILGSPPNLVRLSKEGRVWVDKKKRRVVVDGVVILKSGQLEMFACPINTKEHESVVAVFAKAIHVHAGLLAAGAMPGKPTQFEPYQPATGSTIRIHVLWKDEMGNKKSARAQSWIRHAGTEREMQYDWVFAGSGIYKDEESKQEYYLAEQGDLICVANFTTATLDLAVRSDDANSGLVFMANTKNIPDSDTPVRLVLQVVDTPPARDDSLDPPAISPEEAELWSSIQGLQVPSSESEAPSPPKPDVP